MGLDPRTLSRRPILKQLSHPGAPNQEFFKKKLQMTEQH